MVSINIEMPKNCFECRFNAGEYTKEYYEKRYCLIDSHAIKLADYKKRPKDCPLIDNEKDAQ